MPDLVATSSHTKYNPSIAAAATTTAATHLPKNYSQLKPSHTKIQQFNQYL